MKRKKWLAKLIGGLIVMLCFYLRYDQSRKLTVIYFVIGKDAALVEQTSADYLQPIVWQPLD